MQVDFIVETFKCDLFPLHWDSLTPFYDGLKCFYNQRGADHDNMGISEPVFTYTVIFFLFRVELIFAHFTLGL